jgi:uncharacterized C2H2 Zn-finger protein
MNVQIPIRCPACDKRFKKSAKMIVDQKLLACPGCGLQFTPPLEEYAKYLLSVPLPELPPVI